MLKSLAFIGYSGKGKAKLCKVKGCC